MEESIFSRFWRFARDLISYSKSERYKVIKLSWHDDILNVPPEGYCWEEKKEKESTRCHAETTEVVTLLWPHPLITKLWWSFCGGKYYLTREISPLVMWCALPVFSVFCIVLQRSSCLLVDDGLPLDCMISPFPIKVMRLLHNSKTIISFSYGRPCLARFFGIPSRRQYKCFFGICAYLLFTLL